MSKDLKRAVETERRELKAHANTIAELRQSYPDVPGTSADRKLADDRRKLTAQRKVIAAMQND